MNKYSLNAFREGNHGNEIERKINKIYGDIEKKNKTRIKDETIRIKRLNVVLK